MSTVEVSSQTAVPAVSGSNTAAPAQGGLSLLALASLVVGSMVGGGVFFLPQAFGQATGVLGAMIAWAISGTGMLMLALVFQTLATRRADIDTGIVGYVREGFGDYVGFLAVLAYWAGAVLGNVALLLLLQSTLGAYWLAFGDGNTIAAIVGASVILWAFHAMLLCGVRQATTLNVIVTAAKLVPILIFIAIAAWAIRPEVLLDNLAGPGGLTADALFAQLRNTMLITVFVFLGIEGASVYSRMARRRKDVGRATVLGFLSVLAILICVTLLPYGVMPREEIAALHNPSMAGVLERLIGPSGALFVSLGLAVSVLGAFLSWLLLSAEVLSSASRSGVMPAFLGRENDKGAPETALWITNGFAQIILLLTLFSHSTFRLAAEMAGAMGIIPYALVAGFGVLVAARGTAYASEPRVRRRDLLISLVAVVYAGGMIYAGGLTYLLLALAFAPGTLLFIKQRQQSGQPVFRGAERWLAGIIAGLAVIAVGVLVGHGGFL